MKIKINKKHALMFIFAVAFVIAISGSAAAADNTSTSAVSEGNTVITGNVIQCSDDEPFSGVTITVSDKKNILATTTTDVNGNYSVAFDSGRRVFEVTASYPGHLSVTQQVKISNYAKGQKIGYADFQLGPRTATYNGLKRDYYRSIYIEDHYDGYYGAGTMKVTIDGTPYDAYCIDIFTGISSGKILLVNGALVANGTGNLPSGVDWSKVNYILYNYSADGIINGSNDKAINGAAIQSAIWYFTSAPYGKYSNTNRDKYQFMTDPMDKNYDAKLETGLNKAAVRTLAQYIIDQANATNFKYPVSISVEPESSILHNGDSQTLTITVYDQNNNPLSGINVSLSTDRGILSSVTGTTGQNGAAGKFTVTLTTNGLNSGTANILAWVTGNYGTLLYYDPSGTPLQDLTTTTTIPNSIQDSATVTFAKKADVSITKTASNSTPKVGEQFYYTITLTNNGPDDATNVNVTDIIPGGLTFNSSTATQGSYTNGTWTVGTLLKFTTVTLTLYVTPTTPGQTIINTATETQTEYDPTPATADVTVNVRPAVEISNDGVYNSYCDKIIWQVYAENTTTESISNVIVTDQIMPNSFTKYWRYYVSYDNGVTWVQDGTYNNSNGQWTINLLPAGAKYILSIYATPQNGTSKTYTNTATYSGQTANASLYIPDNNVTIVTKTGEYNNQTNQIIWTVGVANNGKDAAKFSVWDLMGYDCPDTEYDDYQISYDNGATWVQDGTYDPESGEWIVSNLNKGETFLLKIYSTPLNGSGTYTNTAVTSTNTEASASVYVP